MARTRQTARKSTGGYPWPPRPTSSSESEAQELAKAPMDVEESEEVAMAENPMAMDPSGEDAPEHEEDSFEDDDPPWEPEEEGTPVHGSHSKKKKKLPVQSQEKPAAEGSATLHRPVRRACRTDSVPLSRVATGQIETDDYVLRLVENNQTKLLAKVAKLFSQNIVDFVRTWGLRYKTGSHYTYYVPEDYVRLVGKRNITSQDAVITLLKDWHDEAKLPLDFVMRDGCKTFDSTAKGTWFYCWDAWKGVRVKEEPNAISQGALTREVEQVVHEQHAIPIPPAQVCDIPTTPATPAGVGQNSSANIQDPGDERPAKRACLDVSGSSGGALGLLGRLQGGEVQRNMIEQAALSKGKIRKTSAESLHHVEDFLRSLQFRRLVPGGASDGGQGGHTGGGAQAALAAEVAPIAHQQPSPTHPTTHNSPAPAGKTPLGGGPEIGVSTRAPASPARPPHDPPAPEGKTPPSGGPEIAVSTRASASVKTPPHNSPAPEGKTAPSGDPEIGVRTRVSASLTMPPHNSPAPEGKTPQDGGPEIGASTHAAANRVRAAPEHERAAKRACLEGGGATGAAPAPRTDDLDFLRDATEGLQKLTEQGMKYVMTAMALYNNFVDQAHTELSEARARADLSDANANAARAALNAERDLWKADKESARLQLEAEKESARSQFEAEKESARLQFDAEKESARSQFEAEMESARLEFEAEKESARVQFEAELLAERNLREAEKQSARAEIKSAHAKLDRERVLRKAEKESARVKLEALRDELGEERNLREAHKAAARAEVEAMRARTMRKERVTLEAALRFAKETVAAEKEELERELERVRGALILNPASTSHALEEENKSLKQRIVALAGAQSMSQQCQSSQRQDDS